MNSNIPDKSKTRFVYLDNIRWLVILLVVVLHSAVTYSGLGGWYYIEGSYERLPAFSLVFFGLMQSFIQAWSMGILFFISAYLAVKALAKRGAFNFIKERLFRLGVPLLLYVFIISPVIEFVIIRYYKENNFLKNYTMYLKKFHWLGATGPLWFVQVLLILCVIYAVIKKFFPHGIKVETITARSIIFTILTTTVIAFSIRLLMPVGESFYNLQFPYFASYIIMFIAGIIIGENNLLDKISDSKNIRWILYTLIIGLPLWCFIMVFGGALDGKTYFNGGLHWQNAAFALWESLTAIGFSTGLIALFKKRVNTDNEFTRLMRDNAFGIYFFHAPILITISLTLKHWIINPLLKFIIVAAIAVFITLIFSFLIRKIKPVGMVIR